MQQRAVLYYIAPISATVPDPLKRPKWKNERKKKITKQDSAESKKIEKKWVYVDQDIHPKKDAIFLLSLPHIPLLLHISPIPPFKAHPKTGTEFDSQQPKEKQVEKKMSKIATRNSSILQICLFRALWEVVGCGEEPPLAINT